MNTEIPADKELVITLQAQQWSLVIQILSEGPYKIVQPLIATIVEQAQKQGAVTSPIPNGAIEQPRAS